MYFVCVFDNVFIFEIFEKISTSMYAVLTDIKFNLKCRQLKLFYRKQLLFSGRELEFMFHVRISPPLDDLSLLTCEIWLTKF